MDNFDHSYSETEYDDCLISLIRLHNLDLGESSEIWDNLLDSFNAVTGEVTFFKTYFQVLKSH